MPWHAQLQLDYDYDCDGSCHNVLVHPPGSLVGGDTLSIQLHARAGAHGLVTTPGATHCG